MDDSLTNYKIIGFNEAIAQILVKFDLVDHAIPLDLHPDENGMFLEGEELDRWIRGACPTGFIVRKQLIQSGIKNIDSIRALVQPPEPEPVNTDAQDVPANPVQEQTTPVELNPDEILSIVNKLDGNT